MKKFYDEKSAKQSGTLSNLKYLINRKNMSADLGKAVKKDYHATSDFVDVTTDDHILAMVMRAVHIEVVVGTSSVLNRDTSQMCIVYGRQEKITGRPDRTNCRYLSSC